MGATSPAAQAVWDIIEASRYLVLATAGAAGRPWSSPVYFAHLGFSEFFWVSSPDVTHSRNVAVRPEVGIVVFDPQVPIGTGQGVYMSAVAELLEGGQTTGGSRRFPAVRWPTAAGNGRPRTSGPALACDFTGRPRTRTGSSATTAGPTTAFPCRSPDIRRSGANPETTR